MIYLLHKERVDCIYISHDVLKYNIEEFFDTPVPVFFSISCLLITKHLCYRAL
eukprot:UN20118